MNSPDLTGAMTRGAARAQELAAERERQVVIEDVRRELAEAAAALVSSEVDRYAAEYFDWLRDGRQLSGQPQRPRVLACDVAKIVKERVTDRTLALRTTGRAA